jgi:tape measure domain-containing protein
MPIQLGGAFIKITADMSGLRRGFVEAERTARRTAGAVGGHFRKLGSVIASVARSVGPLLGIIGGAFLLRALARQVRALKEATLAYQSMTGAIRAVSETQQIAGAQLEFVENTAKALGQDLATLTRGYVQLTAAARGTNIEGSQTRDLFLGIVEAGTALQLSNEQVQGTIFAVQQIISKGQVTAEELRRQLGDRLPGAVQLMASALGVGTAELNRMLEAGELMADDVLPKFAAALRDTYGEGAQRNANLLRGQLNRLSTAVFKLRASLGERVSDAGLSEFIGQLARLMGQGLVEEFFGAIATGVGWMMRVLAEALRFLNAFIDTVESLSDLVFDTDLGRFKGSGKLPADPAKKAASTAGDLDALTDDDLRDVLAKFTRHQFALTRAVAQEEDNRVRLVRLANLERKLSYSESIRDIVALFDDKSMSEAQARELNDMLAGLVKLRDLSDELGEVMEQRAVEEGSFVGQLRAELEDFPSLAALAVSSINSFGDAAAQALMDADNAADIFKDTLRSLIQELAAMAIKMAALKIFGKIVGGPTGGGILNTIAGQLPGFGGQSTPNARGGAVFPRLGHPVGDNEMFLPNTPGTVIPAGAGGVNVVVNDFSGAGVDVQDRGGIGGQRSLEVNVGTQMAKNVRSGGAGAQAMESSFGLTRKARLR